MASKQNRAASSDALEKIPRRTYERELARLQQELVNMQEWVRTSGARVVVVFEGRDAAGKGGDQAVHRGAQSPAGEDRRAARADRAGAHPVVLPALHRASAGGRRDRLHGPVLVQPGRRRTGDGVLHAGRVPALPAPDPDLRATARRGRNHAAQVLVLGVGCGAGEAFPVRLDRPEATMEALADGLESISKWEDYSRAKDEMFVHTDTRGPVVGGRGEDKRRARLNMIAHLLSSVPYREVPSTGGQTAEPAAGVGLRPATPRVVQDRPRSRRDADQVAQKTTTYQA